LGGVLARPSLGQQHLIRASGPHSMKGILITFEGTEGSGKSTQIQLLAEHLRKLNRVVRVLREPGGTPIGEEIRHTLQHSAQNQAMSYETELLLMNASRAQLVRQVIRPALAAGEVVLCDRFYDSTTAYQGHGRGLDAGFVQAVIDFAVGSTRPHLTLLLNLPLALSEARRQIRQKGKPIQRDRIEAADRHFFERVEAGYQAIAAAEPQRVKVVDAGKTIETIQALIWNSVNPLLA